jgi:chondroitin sulfate synthase
MEPGLNKFTPLSEGEVLTWDFISRSLYSASNTNPRRRIESPLKEGLDDVVREVTFCINILLGIIFI